MYKSKRWAPLPVAVSATDSRIRYIGRFDRRDKNGPRCAWSASAVQLKFVGTALNVGLNESGGDELQIVIDGKPTDVLKPQKGPGWYTVAENLPKGEHTALLMKRTEAGVGTTQFLGFQLEAGARLLSLPKRPRHRIEVIGDSITCGYGNEGADRNQHFKPATENAYLTYGAIAARNLDAEYVGIAWSGRTMYPSFTIPEIYDLALPSDPASAWDFRLWAPEVVVINLGTNDFGGKANPEQKPWSDAYKAFLARLHKVYPKSTTIYLATGPMMSDGWPPNRKALSTLKGYLNQIAADQKQAGDTRIRTIDFAMQEEKNGIGSDWHPSVRTHEIMAAHLTETLRRDLNWK
ncbi:MAG: SGNH/GDSL hydrolase family protein [Armatimonas sp.]